MRSLYFFAAVLFPCISFALPEEIESYIDSHAEQFEAFLMQRTSQQRQLVLERFSEKLIESQFTLGMKLSKNELLAYLPKRFPNRERGESKLKRPKTAEFETTTLHDLKLIRDRLGGELRGDTLEVKFTCAGVPYLFPFHVREAKSRFDLELMGLSVPETEDGDENETESCLNLILPSNKSESAEIDHLGTLDTACPIPGQKGGTCLIALSEGIARAAGHTKIELGDLSQIMCPKDRRRASLKHFYVYRHGRTWYQSKGFVVKESAAYEASISRILDYKLSDLLKNALVKKDKDTAKVRFLLKAKADLYNSKHEKDNVAAFMSWLWDDNCSDFVDIDHFITNSVYGVDFAHKYPVISTFEKRL